MPRFHFNVYDGVTSIDNEGTQLPDTRSARTGALQLASDLLKSEAAKENLGEEWRVEVTDGRGMILFRIDIMMNDAPALRPIA